MMSTAREGGGETRMPALLGFSRPAVLLRAEGATLLLTSVLLYWMNGGSWLLFALLLLAPDLSMLGYLAGSRAGAAIYNVFHAYPLPAVLGAFGLLGGSPPAVAVALVWFAHIGMDRLVGYGLKYPTEAKDTHLGRVQVAPRPGLTREAVVEAAASLADEEGLDGFTLADLASRLGVRTPSLYNHVAGLGGLRRELALLGLREMGRRIGRAAMGKTTDEATFAVARAYRDFVKERPGLYAATVRSSRLAYPDDPEFEAAESEAFEAVLAVLASYGLRGEEALHAARGLRSVVHGFATLEVAGGFGIPLDLDESFERLLRAFVAGLRGKRGK